jgi:ABC-type lipoprotein release transport system permease subunit
MLFEVSTHDPLGMAATLILLAVGGVMASFFPARRATRVNPVQALRYE